MTTITESDVEAAASGVRWCRGWCWGSKGVG